MATEIVIHDGNYRQFINPTHDGEVKKCGTIPRDFSRYPCGYLGKLAKPFDVPLIPPDQQQARLDELTASGGLLSILRMTAGPNGGMIPSRDQDGVGYCWCHSGVSAHLLYRALMNEPYEDLSPFSIGCMIKDFQDEGGWGAEGVEFQGTKGCATSATWPQRSMSRSNDNPNTWAEAAKYKYLEWMDGAEGGEQAKQQLITALLLRMPCIVDYNWWSHSVCAADLVSLNPFRIRIWNSWGDSWSDQGMGILEGSKAVPDGLLVARVTMPSP